MSEEERRSSLASTAVVPITTEPMSDQVPTGAGWPQGELSVVASPPLHSSLEPDTIDNFAQPIACSLVLMIGGSFRMEVWERASVSTSDHVWWCPDRHIILCCGQGGHDAWEFKNLKLKVPPDDTILTLWDAIIRRVQWRRISIDVDPSVVASVSATASQLNTAPASIIPDTTWSEADATVSISNSRAAMPVSNSRAVASVSTSDSEYPAPWTWLDVAPYCPAKDGEESTYQDSTTAVGDVVQGNKGQATIAANSYDAS
jgi:hypothetical protein